MTQQPRDPDPRTSAEDRQDALAQGGAEADTPGADAARSGERDRQRDKEREIQEQLDAALADSFPASDPVSIATSQHEEDWERDRPKPP